ncbi:hypothetical protein LINGRAHAP2_LOCUS15479 [Linum grandiflorum]
MARLKNRCKSFIKKVESSRSSAGSKLLPSFTIPRSQGSWPGPLTKRKLNRLRCLREKAERLNINTKNVAAIDALLYGK